MRLWPRFSDVRLPYVGSHMGADVCGAEGAQAPICNVRHEMRKLVMEAKGSGCREDKPTRGLVRHGADCLQHRTDGPLSIKEAAAAVA